MSMRSFVYIVFKFTIWFIDNCPVIGQRTVLCQTTRKGPKLHLVEFMLLLILNLHLPVHFVISVFVLGILVGPYI